MNDRDRPRSTRLFAGRYWLGAVLGRGGMADVFHATDEVLGRSVAVKIFRVGADESIDARRIEAETRTLASLSHPGLVTLFDAGAAPDATGLTVPYLVMELVDGRTLGDFRAGGVVSPDIVAHIGSTLADALAYIHRAGVVHRDIKPANILVAGHGVGVSIKLTDFGIARVVDADRLTEHGNTIGTAHYLSPEQATGNATGPAADIYSLGLVLIECLSGRMVFEGSSIGAAVARLHRDPAVPAEWGPAWVSLLTEMTSRRAEDRPTAATVSDQLRSLTDTEKRTPTAVLPVAARVPPSETTDTQSRRRPVAWWAVPLAVVAAGVLAAVVVWGSSTTDETAVTEQPTVITPTLLTPTLLDPAPVTTTSMPPAQQAPAQPTPLQPPVASPAPIATAPGNSGNSNGNSGNGNSGNGNSGNGNSGNGNGNGNGNGGNNGNGN